MKITGDWMNRRLYLDGKILTEYASQKIRNHSPDGFNWGYAGSGPAQLALAILLEKFGKEYAERHYQNFKFDFVAALPQADFEMDFDIDHWRRYCET